MRPIKFRAFVEGKMYQVHELSWHRGKLDSLLLVGGDGRFGVDEIEALTQFTGLCDKNGKEIYEGDIVQFFFVTSPGQEHIKAIRWDDDQISFIADPVKEDEMNFLQNNNCEVLGNIYEQPELVK